MARLNPDNTWRGSVGKYSYYKMRGIDTPIVRSKGGASKETIKTHPRFEQTRRINAEFGGRASASKRIMRMLWPLKSLADYNIAGPLNALLKPIQALDDQSELGERNILLSLNPGILEGFSLNRKLSFDSIVRTHLNWSFSQEELQATIDIPALLPGINLFASTSHPVFSMIAVLGIVPDLFYSPTKYITTSDEYNEFVPVMASTSWFPVLEGSEPVSLTLPYLFAPPDDGYSMMLSVGICFGRMRNASTIEQVPYAGAARILAMA
ncbi:hypothetical protein HB364_32775 [Pseudoflavitalea sp. X16]|uniref:hypothetical protein n=1 Tax=Paraflavitalea devenefica TaxID=2716334 RepID=UPI00141DF386|nr:hypothetical protein [Paraflavitalea devenefica]NII29899.1 hypothetical protein [Paraflavitalea devenefica]